MKLSCPAVLVFVVKVQLDTRIVPVLRWIVDPDVDPDAEAKVQSIAVIVPEL